MSSVPPDYFDVVYIDEAHHGSAASWREVIEYLSPQEIVGLTATPERTDGVSIASLFGGEYTTELRLWEAVDDQLLAPFDYVGVDDGTDLRGLTWHRGDYAVGELAELYTGDHERVKAIRRAVERWVEVPSTMRALGFCVSVSHASSWLRSSSDSVLPRTTSKATTTRLTANKSWASCATASCKWCSAWRCWARGSTSPRSTPCSCCGRPRARCCSLNSWVAVCGSPRQDHVPGARLHRPAPPGVPLRGAVPRTAQPSPRQLREQAEAEFPFLPAGCAINLERVARERVLARLKEVTPGTGLVALRKDLARTGASSSRSSSEQPSAPSSSSTPTISGRCSGLGYDARPTISRPQ